MDRDDDLSIIADDEITQPGDEGTTLDDIDEGEDLGADAFSGELAESTEVIDDETGETPAAGLDDVGETTPGITDDTVGAVDEADAEFAETSDQPAQSDAAAPPSAEDTGAREPDDRFDDDDTVDSATTADAGFGDAAPEYASSDTEETYPSTTLQAETQGLDPVVAELGEEGEGDITSEDLM